jgi:hypothetical protein
MVAAGVATLYASAVPPLQRARRVEEERATGLSGASVGWNPISLWHQRTVSDVLGGIAQSKAANEQVGVRQTSSMAFLPGIDGSGSQADERKLLRTNSLELVGKDPAAVTEKIRQLAEHNGGYLVSSQVQGSAGNASAALTIRVPVARFEEVRAEIRKLGLRVESDKLDAQDVTKDYVDREARLRNLGAQELQYLQILKRAATVKDTLEVSDKLNQVRSQIEQQQAEFGALSKQIETVAIAIDLRSEADAQVLGLNWRPLYRIKAAMRDGLEGLGDYVATMTSFAFILPSILLWLMTFVVGAAIAWRILRWVARVLFNFPNPARAVS